jgi:hypothetical protein
MSTVKVLSIDGGGMRGLISVQFMKKFVELWGINPNEIWKEFDIITGSSIGGIVAMCFAMGMSPDDVLPFFNTDGPWIFTTDAETPSVMPSDASKINTIINGPFANPTFYPSDVPDIGTMRLKDKLTAVFGTTTLQDLNTDVVITSFEKDDSNPDFAQSTNTPIYFSSVSNTVVPGLIGQNALAVDVGMSTSAAPLYFAPYSFTLPGAGSAKTYIDGGVTQNNPSSFGLSIGKALKPGANRYCVLSLGTGLGDVGFPPEEPIPGMLGTLEGAYLIMYLLGAMNTGPQEIIAKEMDIRANYTLENLFNYRAQYYLQADLDTELDNSSSDIRTYYTTSSNTYFDNNIAAITNFLAHLVA